MDDLVSEPLFTKYRPSSFDEVVGQDEAVALLKKQLADDKVRQAYLISGPHGTGKTTLARLLAKALGATDLDIYEQDAGSARGIDDVRRLQEMAMLMPLGGRRVFILDEAHQFTDAADNALLKILEEPPSSALFVLCTTEPQKVKATVRSRCQQIKLKRPSTKDVVELLSRIATAEDIHTAAGAYGAIAEATGGSFRDAVSLLDQLDSAPGEITPEAVRAFAEGTTGYFDLVDALASGDVAKALEVGEAAFASGADPAVWLNGLLDHLRQLLVVRVGGKVWGPQAPKLTAQSKRTNPEIVRAFASSLVPATDVVRRTDLRLLLVLAMLDMAEAFHKEKS